MTTLTTSFFTSYLNSIEQKIDHVIQQMGPQSALRDAIEYSLKNGGKRLRPIIVMLMAEAIGKNHDVLDAALCVEFFHTASLIADDLPCMDNDDFRRNKPSLHKAFGEDVAILASYTLISAGYERIGINSRNRVNGPNLCSEALKIVSKAAGIFGATNGQFLDLYPPNYDLETIKKIIYQKTVTLFEISFVLGWIFGEGDLDKIDQIKDLAFDLGFAFQVADDLQDMDQDEKNIAHILGEKNSLALYQKHLDAFKKKAKDLKIFSPGFHYLCDLLDSLVAI